MNIKLKKVNAETWARTIFLVIALLNQILAIAGKGTLNFTEEEVYQYVSMAVTVVSAIIAWWKNNSFTEAAQTSDRVKDGIKAITLR